MTPARILIVEDEQITAADVEDTLRDFGYDVVGLAATGAEALRLASSSHPHLALMDIRLKGDIDGTEAAGRLRRQYGVPSIFLTAHADDATLERAKLAEPLGYIVKPFHGSELQAAIEMAMHKRSVDEKVSRREAEYSSTLRSLGEAVVRVDSMGNVRFLNPAAERWSGWSAKESTGRHITEMLQLLDKGAGRPLESFLLGALRERSVVQFPSGAVLRSHDGVERAVSGNIAPVRDAVDRLDGAVIAFGKTIPGPSTGDETEKAAAPSLPAPSAAEPAEEVIVASQAMRDLMKFTARIAASGVTAILLQGESGVGKDVLARYLHLNSKRRDQPFIAVNCAAIPETLLESELFGYEKGAFTDARAQKKGVLDLADGGTVFLDEIGELQPHIQAKLLRVLEDQTFRRLGGVKDISVDLRIITATNRNLGDAVRDHEFREDLYYRLNVIQISIPPIRERKEDVMPLAEFFVRRFNRKFERNIQGVSPEAERALLLHDWPGNVREIRNTIERAMVLETTDHLQADNIAFGAPNLVVTQQSAAQPAPVSRAGASLEEVEKGMLTQALEKCEGNQTRAARMLGITRDTLRYRVKKFGLK